MPMVHPLQLLKTANRCLVLWPEHSRRFCIAGRALSEHYMQSVRYSMTDSNCGKKLPPLGAIVIKPLPCRMSADQPSTIDTCVSKKESTEECAKVDNSYSELTLADSKLQTFKGSDDKKIQNMPIISNFGETATAALSSITKDIHTDLKSPNENIEHISAMFVETKEIQTQKSYLSVVEKAAASDCGLSAGAKLMQLLQAGPLGSKQKKTILPPDLLKDVTEKVRAQNRSENNSPLTDIEQYPAFCNKSEIDLQSKSNISSMMEEDSSIVYASMDSSICTYSDTTADISAEESDSIAIVSDVSINYPSIVYSNKKTLIEKNSADKHDTEVLEMTGTSEELTCSNEKVSDKSADNVMVERTLIIQEPRKRETKCFEKKDTIVAGKKGGKLDYDTIKRDIAHEVEDEEEIACDSTFKENVIELDTCSIKAVHDETTSQTSRLITKNKKAEGNVQNSTAKGAEDLNQSVNEATECDLSEISDLLQIDPSVVTDNKKQEDKVFDLSLLFSGELEKRRKQMERKEKRKAKSLQKYQRQKNKGKYDSKEETEDKTAYRKPKRVVNHFIAVQISNKNIKTALEEVQGQIVEGNPKLREAIIRPSSFHITLMVLALNSQEDLQKSAVALDAASVKLLSSYTSSPLRLDIAGLGDFRNEVVFAKVKTDSQVEELKKIAETVEDCHLSQDLVSPDSKAFKPHITIAKMSKVKQIKKKGLKKIDKSLYKGHDYQEFGTEYINTIQLCSMIKPKDKFGYYHVEHAVQFGCEITPDNIDSSNDTENETAKKEESMEVKVNANEMDDEEFLSLLDKVVAEEKDAKTTMINVDKPGDSESVVSEAKAESIGMNIDISFETDSVNKNQLSDEIDSTVRDIINSSVDAVVATVEKLGTDKQVGKTSDIEAELHTEDQDSSEILCNDSVISADVEEETSNKKGNKEEASSHDSEPVDESESVINDSGVSVSDTTFGDLELETELKRKSAEPQKSEDSK